MTTNDFCGIIKVVVGGVQGAVEGYKETGNLDGTLRGMIKGAVQGAQDGLLSGMVMGGIGGAMNPSFCFVAGTTVLTTLGKKAIETIQVGDTIPCVDHITGESAEKRVITTTVNKVNRLIELDIDGEIIQCTETHPFQVKGRGWVNAIDLAPNDIVYTKDWNTATVKSVNLLELDEPVEVFNFEVEDCHTYFVGELGVLVHNACQHTKSNYRNNAKKYYGTDGVGQEAHHIFPQKFNNYFIDRGINIHAPQNIKFMQTSGHRANSYAYNQMWQSFIDSNPNASVKTIQIAGQYFMKFAFG